MCCFRLPTRYMRSFVGWIVMPLLRGAIFRPIV